MSNLDYLRAALVFVPLLVATFFVFASEARKFEQRYGRKCEFALLLGQFFKFQTRINKNAPYQQTAIAIVFAMFPYMFFSFGIGAVSLFLF